MAEGIVTIVVVLTIFIAVTGIILTPVYLKERTKRSAHSLIAQAMEKGQTLDPNLMQRLTESIEVQTAKQQNRPRRTLGNGVVLLALAGGFAGASYFNGDFDDQGGMLTAAVIMGSLGLAFTLLAIVDYVTTKKSGA